MLAIDRPGVLHPGANYNRGCAPGAVSKEAILLNLVKTRINQTNKNNYLWIPAFEAIAD